jgi:hypothetical protein
MFEAIASIIGTAVGGAVRLSTQIPAMKANYQQSIVQGREVMAAQTGAARANLINAAQHQFDVATLTPGLQRYDTRLYEGNQAQESNSLDLVVPVLLGVSVIGTLVFVFRARG